MALSVYPVTGDITAAGFAAALDALFGQVDHANSDLAFRLTLQSQEVTINTWVLTAGSYLFDGYIFTSDGTEIVEMSETGSWTIYLYYVLAAGYITSCGIAETTNVPAGAVSKALWVVNGPTAASTAPNSRTDNRRINTWGRTAYANSDADAVTLAATRSVQLANGGTVKSFRVAYPGTYQLDFEYKEPDGGVYYVGLKRGGTLVSSTNLAYNADWTAYSAEIAVCQPGDTIEVVNATGNPLYVRSAYLRYKLTDAAAAAVLVD